MESLFRPTRAEVSLAALRHNMAAFQAALPDRMKIMAVVKANGYGHGAAAIAREALNSGASYLAVALLDEALELRKSGIDAPILVLGYTAPAGLQAAREQNITLTVFNHEALDALSRLEPTDGHGSRVNVHLKLDTGMGRLGIRDPLEAVNFIEAAMKTSQIHVEGLYTHYACADDSDKAYTLEQYRRISQVVDLCRDRGIAIPLVHAGNSAAAIDCPELSFDMVRLGISLYGFYPSEEVKRERVELQPLLSFKTGIIMLKTLPEGAGISYGATYRTRGDELIATIPVGYADGFTRMLTGRVEVLVRGRRAPVVGRICMDQCMIDVSHIPGVALGDEVVLIGRQGDEQITADDWARTLGTINYEITCMIGHRVPRVYTDC